MIRNVTVYCSSSKNVAEVYKTASIELGGAIAQSGWGLVYGGNDLGLMGLLAGAVRAAGGKVVGVTPRIFIDQGCADNRCDELVVATSMRDRKQIMEERGDAFIALPGGLGTLEEIFEIIVARILGLHNKPIVLLNIANYYAPLLAMIDHGIDEQFIKPKARAAYHVATDVPSAIKYLISQSQQVATPPPNLKSAIE